MDLVYFGIDERVADDSDDNTIDKHALPPSMTSTTTTTMMMMMMMTMTMATSTTGSKTRTATMPLTSS